MYNLCYIYNGVCIMSGQLVIDDFIKVNECDKNYVSLDGIYHMFVNNFRELSDLRILIDKLYDDLSPITYDVEFKHILFYDNRDKVYRYQRTELRINNVDIHLSGDNNILFSVYDTSMNELYLISNFVNENKNAIRYILSIYKKYYSLFSYKDKELGDVLGTYYLDDNTYIVVYTNGSIRLFSNYHDISDNEASKLMKINIGDKVDGYCRKLVLSNN